MQRKGHLTGACDMHLTWLKKYTFNTFKPHVHSLGLFQEHFLSHLLDAPTISIFSKGSLGTFSKRSCACVCTCSSTDLPTSEFIDIFHGMIIINKENMLISIQYTMIYRVTDAYGNIKSWMMLHMLKALYMYVYSAICLYILLHWKECIAAHTQLDSWPTEPTKMLIETCLACRYFTVLTALRPIGIYHRFRADAEVLIAAWVLKSNGNDWQCWSLRVLVTCQLFYLWNKCWKNHRVLLWIPALLKIARYRK